jgi:hypothetical protein
LSLASNDVVVFQATHGVRFYQVIEYNLFYSTTNISYWRSL